MQHERYDVFGPVHKGLRLLLYETAMLIQQTDFCCEGAASTLNAIINVTGIFNELSYYEDRYLLPIVESEHSKLVSDIEQDHSIGILLSGELHMLVTAWGEEACYSKREFIGKSISRAYSEFMGFCLRHMDREQTEMLPLFWEKSSDEELQKAGISILEQYGPETWIVLARAFLKGLSTHELLQWCRDAGRKIAADMWIIFLHLAEYELPPSVYRNLQIIPKKPAMS